MKLKLSLLLVLLVFNVAIAADPTELLRDIEQRYNDLTDLEVDFKQEVHSGVFSAVERTEGKMFLAKGDRFRIQTDEQVIASDGKLLWVYSKENKQVTIDKVGKTRDLVRPSDYLFTFRENYNAVLLPDSSISDETYSVILLTSQDKDQFIQRMTLYADKTDKLTRRAVYQDINGNIVEINFFNLKIDKALSPETFIFKAPKGVEEIRLP